MISPFMIMRRCTRSWELPLLLISGPALCLMNDKIIVNKHHKTTRTELNMILIKLLMVCNTVANAIIKMVISLGVIMFLNY